jgi:hypothetical protein
VQLASCTWLHATGFMQRSKKKAPPR